MIRKDRTDWRSLQPELAVGWLTGDGSIGGGLEDSFGVRFAVDDFSGGEYVLCRHPLENDPSEERLFEEVIALGFTAAEYQAALRFSIATDFRDFGRSERELYAIISSGFEGHHNDNAALEYLLHERRSPSAASTRSIATYDGSEGASLSAR